MGARIRKIRHDENTRLKIQASQIVNRMRDHMLGKVEMSSTQVACATVLLKKVLPDLSAADVTTRTENAKAEDMDDNALAARIAALESEDKDANHTEH